MVVVYTDMNGISFHDGHASFLQACKKLGDVLLVGVCSDAIGGLCTNHRYTRTHACNTGRVSSKPVDSSTK
jgi:cytidyltransferase-like protein